MMTKKDAIAMFGGKQIHLATALGITQSAVSQWADELTREQEDRVIGAAVRLGLWKSRSNRGNRAA